MVRDLHVHRAGWRGPWALNCTRHERSGVRPFVRTWEKLGNPAINKAEEMGKPGKSRKSRPIAGRINSNWCLHCYVWQPLGQKFFFFCGPQIPAILMWKLGYHNFDLGESFLGYLNVWYDVLSNMWDVLPGPFLVLDLSTWGSEG